MKDLRQQTKAPGRGAGLMEGIVVIGVMTVVLVVVTQIFAVSYDIYVKQIARAENDTGVILASRTISESVRGATRTLASSTINGTLYTTSKDALVVEMPALNASSNVITDEYDRIAVYRDTTSTDEIWSDTEVSANSVRPSGKKLLTANNTALVFRYNASDATEADLVSMYLENSQTVRGQTFTSAAWSAVFIRNQ